MKNNKIIIGGIGLVVGLVLGLLVFPSFPGGRYGGYGMMGGRQNGVNTDSSGIDRHFIEQMIPHHDGAIAMANLALQKAIQPEIKTLAQEILKAQTTENQEMRTWYKDWFGKNVSDGDVAIMGGMMSQGGMHMGSLQDLSVLVNASDFDKEFIEQMIPHHQMAIMMAQMLKSGTTRPETQQLAKNIIESQSKEIEDMQGWYKLWYQ